MEIVWLIIGLLFVIVGLLGCVVPLLPGPPLCFAGLWIQQLRDEPPFTVNFLLIWAGVTVAVTVLDYIIPIYSTKKSGGSKYGIWGCTIGLLAGFWLGPFGIVIGPLVGAFIGELIAHQMTDRAMKAALGSFVGFMAGTLLKLLVCGIMAYQFFANWRT